MGEKIVCPVQQLQTEIEADNEEKNRREKDFCENFERALKRIKAPSQ